MSKLSFVRIELDNYINGLEISKQTGYWSEDDERTLHLMLMIKDVLEHIVEDER